MLQQFARFNSTLMQCFSTILLQRNLPYIFALLMEPCAMIQVSILLQPHRTVVTDFVQVISVCFGRTPVVEHCPNAIKFHEGKLRLV